MHLASRRMNSRLAVVCGANELVIVVFYLVAIDWAEGAGTDRASPLDVRGTVATLGLNDYRLGIRNIPPWVSNEVLWVV